MTAGIIPVARGADGEWLMLGSIATKKGVWTLSPLKGKRNAGETTPMHTALRGFNQGTTSGVFKTLTTTDLDERKWLYSPNGKMVFTGSMWVARRCWMSPRRMWCGCRWWLAVDAP